MEGGSTPSCFSKRKEEVTERDTGDEAVKEVKRHLHGAHLKRVKPSLTSLEIFQEQLRAVKRKVSIWYEDIMQERETIKQHTFLLRRKCTVKINKTLIEKETSRRLSEFLQGVGKGSTLI